MSNLSDCETKSDVLATAPDYEEQTEISRTYETSENLGHVGWPGDGTGEDDFADFNQNESDDYRDE